jgi:hypothetical protein
MKAIPSVVSGLLLLVLALHSHASVDNSVNLPQSRQFGAPAGTNLSWHTFQSDYGLDPSYATDMCFAQGLFFATFEDGRIAISEDGTEFKSIHSGTSQALWSIHHANNTLIAVGNGMTILRSEDGLVWEPLVNGLPFRSNRGYITDLIYANDYFLARSWNVSDGGIIVASGGNGNTWFRAQVAPEGHTFNNLVHSGGVFIADDTEGNIYRSENGAQWEVVQTIEFSSETQTKTHIEVLWDGFYMTRLDTEDGGSNETYYSEDGTSWEEVYDSTEAEEGDENLLYFNPSGELHMVRSQPDGSVFRFTTVEDEPNLRDVSVRSRDEWSSTGQITINSAGIVPGKIQFSGSTYLAYGGTFDEANLREQYSSSSPITFIYTSAFSSALVDIHRRSASGAWDGLERSTSNVLPGMRILAIKDEGVSGVTVLGTTLNRDFRSIDGINWQESFNSGRQYFINGGINSDQSKIWYFPETDAFVSAGDGIVQFSSDGITWNSPIGYPFGAVMEVVYGSGAYQFLSSLSGGGNTTSYLNNFNPGTGFFVSRAADGELFDVAFGGSTFLWDARLRSTNGMDWAPTQFPADHTATSLFYYGDRFYAFASRSSSEYFFLESLDGNTWQRATSIVQLRNSDNILDDVVIYNGRFISPRENAAFDLIFRNNQMPQHIASNTELGFDIVRGTAVVSDSGRVFQSQFLGLEGPPVPGTPFINSGWLGNVTLQDADGWITHQSLGRIKIEVAEGNELRMFMEEQGYLTGNLFRFPYMTSEHTGVIYYVNPLGGELKFYDHSINQWVDRIGPASDDILSWYQRSEQKTLEIQILATESLLEYRAKNYMSAYNKLVQAYETQEILLLYNDRVRSLVETSTLPDSIKNFWTGNLEFLANTANGAIGAARYERVFN